MSTVYGRKMESGEAKAAKVAVRAGAASVGACLTATLGPEAGAAAAESLAQGAEALLVGWLDRRSTNRVRRTLIATSEKVKERRDRGEQVRGALKDPKNPESTALFEAVVATAAQSEEDRKCAVIANTYASIAVDPLISIGDALLYMRRIRGSSWRQLVALQFLLDGDRSDERGKMAAAGAEGEAQASPALAAEMVELAETLGLVGIGEPGGYVGAPSATMGGGGFTTQSLANWTATGLGRELARLGELKNVVQSNDLDHLARGLAESDLAPNA